MFNTEEEKRVLVESIRKTTNPQAAKESLQVVLEKQSPIALYIATADRRNCMWLFNPSSVYDMLGGEDIHHKIEKSIFTTPEEREEGILCYVFNKVEKTVAIRLSKQTIREVIEGVEG